MSSSVQRPRVEIDEKSREDTLHLNGDADRPEQLLCCGRSNTDPKSGDVDGFSI